jgi:hypothetical protein
MISNAKVLSVLSVVYLTVFSYLLQANIAGWLCGRSSVQILNNFFFNFNLVASYFTALIVGYVVRKIFIAPF